jgi:DNA-binding LacI/PurR family transcriptional regulator
MQFFREYGISIPGDVSITGIDNIDYNGIDSLKLTTVDLNVEESIRQMMDLFMTRYSGAYRGDPREVRIDRYLVIGNSTAQAPEERETGL